MTNTELKKLSRRDLIEILLEVSKENQQLREQLEDANRQLEDRRITIENAGSLADAALSLNGVFAAAEAACKQYCDGVQDRFANQEQIFAEIEQKTRERCEQMERQTKENCERMMENAKRNADAYWEETWQKVQNSYANQKKGKGWGRAK